MITVKRIGVLMGGMSSERNISLKTGGLAAASLIKKGYNVVTIDAGKDLPERLIDDGIEVAFIALHGRYGEDGCVQGLLEVMGIPYTGSGVSASTICMDKLLTKKMLEHHGISTPKFSVCTNPPHPLFSLNPQSAIRNPQLPPPPMRYPFVVKPCREGSTIGVSIVSGKEGVSTAMEDAFRYGDTVIIEEYIPGVEVTAGIIDDKPLPLVEIVPREGFYDYNTKTTGGMAEYIVPARLSESITKDVQAIALETHRVLGCCYVSRVDFRVDPSGYPYVLEVNTIPGMTETSLLPMAAKEAGISYDELVEMILSSAFKKGSGLDI